MQSILPREVYNYVHNIRAVGTHQSTVLSLNLGSRLNKYDPYPKIAKTLIPANNTSLKVLL